MTTKTISEATLTALQTGELTDGVFRVKTWIGDAGFRELRELFAPCSGKWSRTHRGFVFELCPKELIAQSIASGRYVEPVKRLTKAQHTRLVARTDQFYDLAHALIEPWNEDAPFDKWFAGVQAYAQRLVDEVKNGEAPTTSQGK